MPSGRWTTIFSKGLRRYSEEQEDLEDKIKKVHTVGYWEKPNNKDIKNWCGVVTPKSINATTVYPKEQALEDICKLHKAAGHQIRVYCQMTGKRDVQPRLKEILTRAGLKVGIMRADDVEPKEREEWIAKHGRNFDVMICFPQLVSTGLDPFSKVQGGHNYDCIVFYETRYKLNMMRQAARRAWRIGQPRDCYIYYMYYKDTMQHRAMSLMSKKMAAALALEGEFSEEGLAAMAGEGDDQMALAKSMSEKIDDADMQRSWSKVKSLTEKKKPIKKKSLPTLSDLAADATPDKLDTLVEEAQLLARTILERQKKAVPASAMPDIISLAERFAQADEGMWGAARAIAFREEVAPTLELTCSDSRCEDVVIKVGVNDNTKLGSSITVNEAARNEMTLKAGEFTIGEDVVMPVKTTPNLKVHQPKSEKRVDEVVDDIEFDDTLIAKMFANLAAHGMKVQDLAG